MNVLAYHLTWTTYGTWLPGDKRGWVKKKVLGIQEPDPEREKQALICMAENAVVFTPAQRALVEQTIRAHCRFRNWTLHAVNARSNHIHVVVTANSEPDEIMNQLKAWCSRKLSDAAGLKGRVAVKAGRRRWFTEGGDKSVIEDEDYLTNAVRYVLEGQ
ncbi:MAG TPA: transposase [Gemmataceae bacterium]|nr:transposase [Gemmataceae bacterium]